MEMGQRLLLLLLGSAPGFFSIGVMATVLKSVGTIPVESEDWMMAEMGGNREGRQAFTRTVGRAWTLG